MKEIIMYTDGACAGNPGRGGWAAAAFDEKGETIMKASGGFRKTTNNRMEILAVANGLKTLKAQFDESRETDIKVTVCSDSQLVVSTMNDGWGRGANKDLWNVLDDAVSLFKKVEFKKVKGHSNDAKNNLVDEMAVAAYDIKNTLEIDRVYEGISPYEENSLFPLTDEEVEKMENLEPEILQIRLLNHNVKELREVEVDLSNGTTVKIVGLYGGFEQFNCNRCEAAITLDVARRFTGWLNGKNL